MYGDHSRMGGMLMGGPLDGEMIYGAGHEEDLGFRKFFKKKVGRGLKKVFNKKNLKKVGKVAGKVAIGYAKT